ncbi:lysophospholipid acyltransferase family protein [Mycolicibacterium mengxianglii]|uniref:lysophospholipid acyltransferase family protein n=1 Tax=Mycolicibacterium mengxianglii TaxID=2736649 RepID=UPI0018D07DB6|nr:lysophospholipid acyltransferase family protein [Mycolicibacterium mengxianglii]
MEPVYRTLEIAAEVVVRVFGTEITFDGLEHIPQTGGAVVAINHISYTDWLFAALAAKRRSRRMRFMIKAEMTQVKLVNFLITHTKTIPVNRRAGADAYVTAVARLREGELVGVFPEATISRSFELKGFKTGAARMSVEAQVPVVPLIVWGGQRIWTKDQPKKLGHNNFPITVAVGPALAPAGPAEAANGSIRAAMTAVLDRVQRDYEHGDGEYWVPRRLGGTAPTPEEATVLDQAELAERARRQAGRD